MVEIKKGAFVEFDQPFHMKGSTYVYGEDGEGTFGIAIEDSDEAKQRVLLQLADRSKKHVHLSRIDAHSWAGWVPEELEQLYEELFPCGGPDDWDMELEGW